MSSESSLNPHVEDIINEQHASAPKVRGPLTRFNATIARYGMYFSVCGLLLIVAIVFYQVFGRYVLNDSPTWAENLALVLILYVTLIAAAVGVLMARRRWTYQRAFDELARLSQQRNRKVSQIADDVLLTGEFPPPR